MIVQASLPVRPAARIILFDREDRLLLFLYHDDSWFVPGDEPGPADYWATPGGGLEPGESLEQAAHRELREETGFTGVALSPCVVRRETRIMIRGKLTLCGEHFFVVRLADRAPSVDLSAQLPDERSVLRDLRWWTIGDLARSTEAVFPPALAGIAKRLAAGHLPATPIIVTD